MGDYRKWSRMSIGDMALRFKNPFLREAWQRFWIPEMSTWTLLNSLSPMHIKSAVYPVGGSMVLSRVIEETLFESWRQNRLQKESRSYPGREQPNYRHTLSRRYGTESRLCDFSRRRTGYHF